LRLLATRSCGFRRRGGPSRGRRLRSICRRPICTGGIWFRLRMPLAWLRGLRLSRPVRRGRLRTICRWPVCRRRLRAICRWPICAGRVRFALRRRSCPTRWLRRGLRYRVGGCAGFRVVGRRPSATRRRSISRRVARPPGLTVGRTRPRYGRSIVRWTIVPIATITRTAVIVHGPRVVPHCGCKRPVPMTIPIPIRPIPTAGCSPPEPQSRFPLRK
jgi:hypothetical protein